MFDDKDMLNTGEVTDDEMLEIFGDKYLFEAMVIVGSGKVTRKNAELINHALCTLISMYVNKHQDSELNTEETLH